MISNGGWWLVSFAFGAAIGLSEIMLRNRSEPVAAIRTIYGVSFLALNGFSSLIGYGILQRYAETVAPRIATTISCSCWLQALGR